MSGSRRCPCPGYGPKPRWFSASLRRAGDRRRKKGGGHGEIYGEIEREREQGAARVG
jgi:hypothetical protein